MEQGEDGQMLCKGVASTVGCMGLVQRDGVGIWCRRLLPYRLDLVVEV